MRIKSPMITLLVGVLIAVVTVVLSVRAHDAATRPTPPATTNPYGLALGVSR